MPADARISIELCIRYVENRGEFLDAQDHLSVPLHDVSKRSVIVSEQPIDEFFGEFLDPFRFFEFERIESYITVLTESSCEIVDDSLRSIWFR